jgi:2-C-methyl-D-erythritol 2,4-cyclodiphosphate synthase
VVVDSERGVVAHSDGDVVAHAVCDALLGAANLGDLGVHFPSTDSRWRDVDSLHLVGRCVEMALQVGVRPVYVDVTVLAENVKVGVFREQMRERLGSALGLEAYRVSVKATTTDGLGFIGRGEGVAAAAVVTAVADGEAT